MEHAYWRSDCWTRSNARYFVHWEQVTYQNSEHVCNCVITHIILKSMCRVTFKVSACEQISLIKWYITSTHTHTDCGNLWSLHARRPNFRVHESCVQWLRGSDKKLRATLHKHQQAAETSREIPPYVKYQNVHYTSLLCCIIIILASHSLSSVFTVRIKQLVIRKDSLVNQPSL